ncbi:MAG: response regulator [Rhodospirillales bacterium]|jgi:two-component system, cell cycle response regulator|nr:response regulator [Rhodospirillaceae bacterium]MBT7485535.1 response regulator [Rhodospirillales bacterium]MBT5035730.1 response regulator [Rhodospirillaceae bacterium]MBT6218733.1 response regulator [Rhodospirillaceae bacterium]MBT6363627.1 response regulator [Rhodospirillaceae bacterium]
MNDETSLKIFVIDDDTEFLNMIKATLEGRGHSVLTSVSPLFAIHEAASLRPDCILVDLMMPGIDGAQCCSELRERRELTDTRIIMISGRDPGLWSQKIWASGADGFIKKNTPAEKFADELADLLSPENIDAMGRKERVGYAI